MPITSPPYKFALALQGVAADIPAGTDYPQETLYWATDTTTLYVNDGTTFNAVGGGGSGITAWGQVSTSKYAGSGTPIGTVTPDAAGDVYLDETTPALWQATGTGDTDWAEVAAPPTQVQTGFTQGDGSLFNGRSSKCYLTGPSSDGHPFADVITGIPVAIGIGGNAASLTTTIVTAIPLDSDYFDFQATLTVTDLAGTNVITVSVFATVPPDSTSLTVDWSTASDTVVTGVDLSWDGTDNVVSAAGGIYIATLVFATFWD